MAEPQTSTPPDKTPEDAEPTPGESLRGWFKDFIDLRIGSDRAGAVQSIVSGKQMRGSNAWMLVCSIFIASLGLNLNSGAVIIGAMLISPLMNPILGVGLGVGTNDWPLLLVALKNFGISIVIALTTSVIYFMLTPIDLFTEQMQSRTEPTILDVLVAVFGGLAGIISVTRLDKTNAIPGVAIATALMPPLCVSGYGIALSFTYPGEGWYIFWRSFYLFFINSFFIAVTAYIIIRLLRFPYRKYLNKKEARRSMLVVLAISALMIVPSVYILRDVINRLKQDEAARVFTERFFPTSSYTYQLNRDENNNPILVYPIKDRLMSSDSLRYYTKLLQEPPYGLNDARIVTDTSLSSSDLAGIRTQLSGVGNQAARIARLEYRIQKLGAEVATANNAPDAIADTAAFDRMYRQLQIAFPQIQEVNLSMAKVGADTSGFTGEVPLAVVTIERQGRRPPPAARQAEELQLRRYLTEAIARDTVILFVRER